LILAAALGVLTGCSAHTAVQAAPAGPPPEWAENASAWPSPNDGLSNARANLTTEIDAHNVSGLRKRWTFPLRYDGPYGAFTTNPIVLGSDVYFEDPDSTVFALKLSSGALIWKHAFHSVTPSGGPNGVTVGYGLLFGETEGSVFALDPTTGRQVWFRRLAARSNDGIDMAPQLADGRVLISTIPGSSTSFYTGGAVGTVYALAAKTGKVLWSFSTVRGAGKLWGDAKQNSGGGLWYPPAVDKSGRVFIGVANPGPYPPRPDDPNARSRPGPNLYTDSLVALDGASGKLL
jgi:outer membrane protein assembly factor BamB